MTRIASLTESDLSALCKRTFPERPIQQVESVTPMHSRQHEMIAFNLRWQSKNGEYIEPLIIRRYISTISWWRTDDNGKAQRETTVTRWLHQNGLPVSAIYAREFSTQGDVVLFSRLAGNDWSAFGRPFPEIAVSQAKPFAWLLARLHSLEPPEDIYPVVPTVSLSSALANLSALAIQSGLTEVEDAVNRAMSYAEGFKESDSVLVHGDYHFSNVLFDKGQISGIVDWEYCALGDPRWDIANAYMQMVDFGAAEAADIFLSSYLEYSGRQFEGLPLHNVVASLQQWAISEWILRLQTEGQALTFSLAHDLAALRDAHQRRAALALKSLD